jgi:ABC-2 type transport system permease protein
MIRILRLYLIQAWFSYRALYAWSTPFNYLSSKFGFPLFAMVLFVYMGKFVGLTDPLYIVLGNILLMPISNSIYGVSMAIANEKDFGALSYLLGSPAPRAPLFLGRALFQIVDGFITVAVALPIAIFFFHMNLSIMNLPLVIFCTILITVTTSGIGFLMGSISLITRDGWMITTTIGLALYILVGVNFPVSALPESLQTVAYALPITRGMIAARMALAGAGWLEVLPLLTGELLIGIVYILIGFGLFQILERRSLVNGALDNL